MRRTVDYKDTLAEQLLEDVDFAKAYFLQTMEDIEDTKGLEFYEALKYVIRSMGIKEYADRIGMERQNLSKLLARETEPKIETLNRMLKPIGLKVRLELEDAA